MEEWKDIKGYEGYYQVSNLGRVRSLSRVVLKEGFQIHLKGKLKRLQVTKDGYIRVKLSKEGIDTRKLVHRLVWETFNNETVPEGMQINHINEVKHDNRLENLEVVTPKYNSNWGTRNDRRTEKLKGVFNNKLTSKPVYGYDMNGNLVVSFPSSMEAQRNGYTHSGVGACARGELKTYKGLYWTYEKRD